NFCSKIIHREVLFSVNWLSLTLFYRRDFLFCMDFFIYTKYFILSFSFGMRKTLESSPDSCVKCYTMFLPFLLIKIDVFS
ncbi:hypothetical protein CYQ72_13560, partial [Enterococcus faecium]